MRLVSVVRIAFALVLVLICGSGCKPKDTMPAALPADQMPAALEKAFKAAPAEVKELAAQVVASIRAQDYPKAHPQLQALAAAPKLTREQLDVTARALITLNELLQAAQAQGDQKATETLQNYRINK